MATRDSERASATKYWSATSLLRGPNISYDQRSITPFVFQYQLPRETAERNNIPSNGSFPTHLRFIIIRDMEDTSLLDLIVESSTVHPPEDKDARTGRPVFRFRDALRSRRATQKKDISSQLNHNASTHQQATTLTVCFEAVRQNPSRIGFMPYGSRLRPLSKPGILLDNTYQIPKESSSHTIYVETSIETIMYSFLSRDDDPKPSFAFTFTANTIPGAPWLAGLGYGEGTIYQRMPSVIHRTIINSISKISPVNQSCASSLPSNVLRRIALFMIEDRPPMWSYVLLMMGLVNKSWSIVLDLFFELHSRCEPHQFRNLRSPFQNATDLPQLLSIAHSLSNGRPERALLMEKFTMANYRESLPMEIRQDEEYREAIISAVAYVLGLARSLKEVHISHVDFVEDDRVADALWSLRNLETCVVSTGSAHSGWSLGVPVHFDSVQDLMRGWPNLRLFAWQGLGHQDNSTYIEQQWDGEIELQCSLQELSINYERITGLQFSRFFNVPQPQLYDLNLEEVHGLSNYDIYLALSLVTETLIKLRIFNCPISKLPEEEYALDALMPQMNNLTSLIVSANLISSLSIGRKRRPIGSREYTAMRIFHVDHPSILDNLGEAVRTMARDFGWCSVMLNLNRNFSPQDMMRLREVDRVARECGIRFQFQVVGGGFGGLY